MRQAVGLPPQRRSACGAEMKGDVETARRRTAKAFRRARHQSHVRPRKEGRDAEQRPGSPLAVHAMAKRNLGGLAPAPKEQLAAKIGRAPCREERVGTSRSRGAP